jgi:hypothetical protein
MVVATAGAGIAATFLSLDRQAPFPWFWLVVCFASEVLWVKLPLGRSCVTMASAAHFAALLVLPRGEAMLAAGLSGLAAELMVLRKPVHRAAFNSGQATLAVGAASLVIAALGPALPGLGPLPNLLALLAAGGAYFAVNTGAVSIAISLDRRIGVGSAWLTNFGTWEEVQSNGALFSLGAMVAGLFHVSGVPVVLLATLPLLVTWQAYRAHLAARIQSRGEEETRQAA